MQKQALGGVAEWLNAAVLKTAILRERDRGFESLPLRQFTPAVMPGSAQPWAGRPKNRPACVSGIGARTHLGPLERPLLEWFSVAKKILQKVVASVFGSVTLCLPSRGKS